MDIALSGYANILGLNQSQTDLFVFNSNSNLVRAHGVSQRVTLPITSSGFNHAIKTAFKKEIQRGVSNPILVGAIPFDLGQPTQLVVPSSAERVRPYRNNIAAFSDESFIHQVSKYEFKPNHNDFVSMVEEALDIFESSQIKKMVLSKILKMELSTEVDLARLLTNIMSQNPNAYHFSVPLENSVLVGASPELLLSKQGHRIYSNPLAGSAKRLNDKSEDRKAGEKLLQSKKDQYEHRLVVESIQSALSKSVSNLQVPSKPSLISTPTMWHLSTEIEATLPMSNATSIFDLIKNVHPTPAMCGTPTAFAHEKIEALEPHQRGIFSGLVGWSDAQGNGEWAIAIRCAEVSENKVSLFAGAGVVPDSNPESEWLETSAKMRTMLNAFGIEGTLK